MSANRYLIDGGRAGRDRLRLLARVMEPTTRALLDRVGVRPGSAWLDAGCGGGDVTRLLARAVAPAGSVLGIDGDAPQLELARQDAAGEGLENVEFRAARLDDGAWPAQFDGVYMRFVLTHVRDPAGVLARVVAALRPGGVAVVEDIDFRGHFCHPESGAFQRYVELYTTAVARRGGDANIGPRVPSLLASAGCEDVEMHVAQPAGTTGEVKVVAAITMERIKDGLLAEGLASATEIEAIIDELYALAADDVTAMSTVRVVQAWGRRPA